MVKVIINIINFLALGLAVYWGYENKFGAEQLISILAPVSTLLTLNFDRLISISTQTAKVRGDGNKTFQDSSADKRGDQALDIVGNNNEQNQNM